MTKDFGCMVIVNRGARVNIFEKVFHYRAPNFNDYKNDIKFGCEQFNTFFEKNYDPNWAEKKKSFNVEQYMDGKKKSKAELKIQLVDDNNDKKKKKITSG